MQGWHDPSTESSQFKHHSCPELPLITGRDGLRKDTAAKLLLRVGLKAHTDALIRPEFETPGDEMQRDRLVFATFAKLHTLADSVSQEVEFRSADDRVPLNNDLFDLR